MDRRRVIIEGVQPEIDAGRFPIKRVVGDEVTVEADVFTDGHDLMTSRLLWRHEKQRSWRHAPMLPLGNDRWRGSFGVESLGRYRYCIEAWVDPFRTWRSDLDKRVAAMQDVGVDLQIGAAWLEQAAARARGRDAESLRRAAVTITDERVAQAERAAAALDRALSTLVSLYPDLSHATRYDIELEIVVDPARAQFSAWYEAFPRSMGEEGRHGTIADVEARLPYIHELGFDVLYLPPIHPIGTTKRKGRNNAETASADDVGSPWGIGGVEGGHKSVHAELGTIVDFEALVMSAGQYGIDVAMDIAFQVSPDHPYVQAHPEWFRARPDGTVQYAENPPKKYQDIYPFDFDSAEWRSLWEELETIFRFWIEKGVRIFRVDNPHTKPFPFWEWCITRIKQKYPDVLFLAEAFTTPRRMERLGKLGFSQSYTYFSWRNDKASLTEYMEQLVQTDVAEYLRPNFWPNTPDILTEYLQTGGRPAFMNRVILASMLSSNYGIYGPAYELLSHRPAKAGSEEYLDSEKYEIRSWDLEDNHSIARLIARLNEIRKENVALHTNHTLRFHRVAGGGRESEGQESEHIIAFSKASGGDRVRSLNPHGDTLGEPVVVDAPGSDANNVILVVVNMDVAATHHGWVAVDLAALGIDPSRPYILHDLLSDARYEWAGALNYVELNPHAVPAHVFRITQPETQAQRIDVDTES